METRTATHAEAVFIARSLNLGIEEVWDVLRHVKITSYHDMEAAVHHSITRASHAAADTTVPASMHTTTFPARP